MRFEFRVVHTLWIPIVVDAPSEQEAREKLGDAEIAWLKGDAEFLDPDSRLVRSWDE